MRTIRIASIVCLFLLSTLSSLSEEFYITLYTIPPRNQIDFSSPRRMMVTSSLNAFSLHFSQRKHAMGHVFIELAGPEYSTFVESVKRQLFISGRKDVMNGYGLGILFAGIDGRLGFGNPITKDLSHHYHNGKIAFIKAKISEENFDRLTNYLEEYQERGYDRIYNGLNKPREGLGAGCSAFGVSFFEVAGILQPGWEDSWVAEAKVPFHLIGGPTTGNIVALSEVFIEKQWAGGEEPFRLFRIIDPYLIFKWVNEKWTTLMTEDNSDSTAEIDGKLQVCPVMLGKARGLVYDFSEYPAPDEPIFFPPDQKLKDELLSGRFKQNDN
ncbi:MAG: hypothetical protein IH597_14480 [Bacteroidales bacterium]|nr:hypothetical protein [Bacteroidales bacterium]